MGRAKSEQVAQQQEADMALEDKVQAAVERHVTAACAGHAQELENVRLQMQQSLDARAKVQMTVASSHHSTAQSASLAAVTCQPSSHWCDAVCRHISLLSALPSVSVQLNEIVQAVIYQCCLLLSFCLKTGLSTHTA